MHTSDQLLAALLASELDPEAARAVDEHLLACEDCWQDVRAARLGRRAAEQLRQPAPPALADRIRLAVELAPATARPRRPRRQRRGWAAVAAGAAALVAAIVLAVLGLSGQGARHDAPVITALVHLAAQPVATQASPSTTRLGGQTVELRRYPVAGGTAIVATADRSFPTPPDAQTQPGSAMAWTVTRATITVYCPHARVILAGPVPATTLTALAKRLHLY
jgi:hypothetical protein